MFQRKKLFVNPTIQGRLLVQLCIYWLLYNFLLWHATFLIETLPSDGVPAPILQSYGEFCARHVIWLLCMLAAAPILMWDMVKLSHRFAGPLVRLERVAREMARGQRVARVTLRKHDMLNQFLDAFNELVEAHNRRLDKCSEPNDEWELSGDVDAPSPRTRANP
jgi:hypothetical protein